jgi:hypothetical protein
MAIPTAETVTRCARRSVSWSFAVAATTRTTTGGRLAGIAGSTRAATDRGQSENGGVATGGSPCRIRPPSAAHTNHHGIGCINHPKQRAGGVGKDTSPTSTPGVVTAASSPASDDQIVRKKSEPEIQARRRRVVGRD